MSFYYIRSKINPEAIVQGVIVEANEFNEEKYDLDMVNALAWSSDNKKIEKKILELGYDKNTTMNIHFIKEQYTELDLAYMEVTEIDREILTFPAIRSLELSHNHISRLENLPPTIEELILSHNHIDKIDSRLFTPSLMYLNISDNLLSIDHLSKLIS